MQLNPFTNAVRVLVVKPVMDMIPSLLQRSPLRIELGKSRPSAEVTRRSLAFVHSTCAARAEPVSRLPEPLVSGSVPRRAPHAAAVASVSDERQTASVVSHGVEESQKGSDTFQRLGLDHRITVRHIPCSVSEGASCCMSMIHCSHDGHRAVPWPRTYLMS